MVPSIPVCLGTALERAAQEQRLNILLELHDTTYTFGHSLEAAMLPHLGLCNDMMRDSSGGWSSVHNILCVFLSTGENNLLKVNELVCALYEPYKPYQLQYGELEEAHVLIQISAVPLVRHHTLYCNCFLIHHLNTTSFYTVHFLFRNTGR